MGLPKHKRVWKQASAPIAERVVHHASEANQTHVGGHQNGEMQLPAPSAAAC